MKKNIFVVEMNPKRDLTPIGVARAFISLLELGASEYYTLKLSISSQDLKTAVVIPTGLQQEIYLEVNPDYSEGEWSLDKSWYDLDLDVNHIISYHSIGA